MPIISDFPYSTGTGSPDYTYTENSVYQESPEAGVKWRLILTWSGTLTFHKTCRVKRLSAQGGGGGGGSFYQFINGSDGTDGEIKTQENIIFHKGDFEVEIGELGGGGTNHSGGDGGDTIVKGNGVYLSAAGGLGGAQGGGETLSHVSLYQERGTGGAGGTESDYIEYENSFYGTPGSYGVVVLEG